MTTSKTKALLAYQHALVEHQAAVKAREEAQDERERVCQRCSDAAHDVEVKGKLLRLAREELNAALLNVETETAGDPAAFDQDAADMYVEDCKQEGIAP